MLNKTDDFKKSLDDDEKISTMFYPIWRPDM
jgi:hypothetical protein